MFCRQRNHTKQTFFLQFINCELIIINMLKDYDEGYKIIIAGSSGVGKSSLLLRFVDNVFSDNLLSTIGVDFKFKTLDVNGRKVKMQIWDTAGSEAFRSIVSAYYRGANAVVLVFNLTDRISFNEMTDFWIQEVKKYREPNCEIMVLGNKSDMDNEEVTDEQIKKFMLAENITLYRQTSAKTGNQVGDAFRSLAEKLIQIKSSAEGAKKGQKVQNDSNLQKVQGKKKCCS